jgi:hypothetical protein
MLAPEPISRLERSRSYLPHRAGSVPVLVCGLGCARCPMVCCVLEEQAVRVVLQTTGI